MKHFLHMLIGCGLPILLIFVLPLFGVTEGVTLAVFIVLMFSCHLLMMRGHMQCSETIFYDCFGGVDPQTHSYNWLCVLGVFDLN